ncbi:MAG: VTT domain-containing protein [Acidobacteriota bacterium]
MARFVNWIQAFALAIGGPGLFLVAFLDASVLSLPQINDLLIVVMVTRHKSWLLYYGTMATAGSVAGCLIVYYLGRKGGEALLRKRFKSGQVEAAFEKFRRYGMAAVVVPSMLPPPTPFKLFCLAAGASGMSAGTFSAAVAIGRGARYAGEGVLAYYFGEAAFSYLREHGNAVAWWVAIMTAAALAAYYWHRQRRRARYNPETP